jgi:hypothetical protein
VTRQKIFADQKAVNEEGIGSGGQGNYPRTVGLTKSGGVQEKKAVALLGDQLIRAYIHLVRSSLKSVSKEYERKSFLNLSEAGVVLSW